MAISVWTAENHTHMCDRQTDVEPAAEVCFQFVGSTQMLGGPVRLWEALDGVDVRDRCSLLTLRFNFSSVLVSFQSVFV